MVKCFRQDWLYQFLETLLNCEEQDTLFFLVSGKEPVQDRTKKKKKWQSKRTVSTVSVAARRACHGRPPTGPPRRSWPRRSAPPARPPVPPRRQGGASSPSAATRTSRAPPAAAGSGPRSCPPRARAGPRRSRSPTPCRQTRTTRRSSSETSSSSLPPCESCRGGRGRGRGRGWMAATASSLGSTACHRHRLLYCLPCERKTEMPPVVGKKTRHCIGECVSERVASAYGGQARRGRAGRGRTRG